jgi:hypothetical protein
MINIYYNKEKELGFAFFLFSSKQFVIDHQEFGSEWSKHRYLQESRVDLLLSNLEIFSSEVTVTPTETHKVALKRTKDYIIWANKNKENRIKIFEYYIKVIHPFVKDLALSQPKEIKTTTYAMCCMMLGESENALAYEIKNFKQ